MALQIKWNNVLVFVLMIQVGDGGLLCSNTRFGQIYAISDVFQCNENHYEVIKIELWKKNIKQYTSAAKSLLVEEKTCETYKSFGGGKSEEKKKKVINWYSDERYQNHMKKGTCEDENGMELTTPPFTKDYYCEYSWMKHRSFTTLSCLYQSGTVIAQHGGPMISDLGDVSNCEYQEGFCKNNRGIAFAWAPKQEEKEEWLKVGIFNASRVADNHLLIGPLGLSFNLNQMAKENEKNVYKNDAFTVRIITNRGRRASKLEESDQIDMLKAEINRKLQFLADSLLAPAAQLNSMCRAIEFSLRLNKMLAKSNPTQFMRDMLKNDALIAQATSNNFVKVWPCIQISGVTWRKVTEGCYASIPITYAFNKREFKGFLEEQSGIIYDSSIEIPCTRSSPKIFSYENVVYKYQPGHIPIKVNTERIATLPILPQNKSDVMINIPEEWVFNHSDFENHQIQNSVFRNLQERMDYLEDQSVMESPKASLRQDRYAIMQIFGIEGLSIQKLLESLMNWGFRVASLCGIMSLWMIMKARSLRKKRRKYDDRVQSSVYDSAFSMV